MINSITITTEEQYHGNWLKIYLPKTTSQINTATIQNSDGTILKYLLLQEGNNAIDISNISEKVFNLKIETEFEILMRKINMP